MILSSVLLSAALSGALTVSQAPLTSGSVPLGATRVPMLTLTLQASCAAPVTVRTITVHHKGLGSTEDFERLYLLDGTTRLGRAAVLQRTSATALLRPTKLVLPACSKKTLTVAADVSADAATGSEHSLFIETTTDIQADAAVTLQKAATAVTATVPKSAGSVTYAEVPTSSRNVLFGKQRTLLRFSLKADGKAAQAVHAITFTNDGSARNTDLQHLAIYTSNGERVSDDISSLDGDTVRITFASPLIIEKNASRLLTVRGDVTASRRRTIQLELTEPSDVEVESVQRR